MSILVTPETKFLVQGITGGFGGRHAQLSLDYGSQLVAGVTPGKGGQTFADTVPIYDSVTEAVAKTGATSMKEMGKVMGFVMKDHKGLVDSKNVKDIIQGLLG